MGREGPAVLVPTAESSVAINPLSGSVPLIQPRYNARCRCICFTALINHRKLRWQSLVRSKFLSAMIDQLLIRFSSLSIAAVAFVALIARLLYNRYGTGLNNVPGPFLASFTNFYRLAVARGYRPERWHIKLHQKYGDFVRIGPRTVLCSSNKAAKKIYALNAGFVKVRIFHPVGALADRACSPISTSCSKRWRKASR